MLATLFLSFFHFEVDVIRVFKRLLVSASLLPETALVAAFVLALASMHTLRPRSGKFALA